MPEEGGEADQDEEPDGQPDEQPGGQPGWWAASKIVAALVVMNGMMTDFLC